HPHDQLRMIRLLIVIAAHRGGEGAPAALPHLVRRHRQFRRCRGALSLRRPSHLKPPSHSTGAIELAACRTGAVLRNYTPHGARNGKNDLRYGPHPGLRPPLSIEGGWRGAS